MPTKTGHDTLEKVDIIIEEPGYYHVIFFNDEVTPMDFVIEVLQKIFKHNLEKSHDLMLKVHNEGSAVVGIYPYEIAEQKALETTVLARNNGFPLLVKIQKE